MQKPRWKQRGFFVIATEGTGHTKVLAAKNANGAKVIM
jgi:hypothetical protein